MAALADPRKASASLRFNGKNVTQTIKPYLESVTYTDVASGDSDQLDINLQNIDGNWLNKWYPTKGDKVSGSFLFENWESAGKDKTLSLGTFTMDEISFTGGPMVAKFGCVAVPAKEAFRIRERTKTWTNVTVKSIATEIAKRYSLKLTYSASSIKISSLEQTDKTDCSFLFEVCETYGLAMKIYSGGIQIYDQTTLEKKSAVATINRQSFADDNWTYTDSLLGTYTGARISYKSSSDNDEISVYIGLIKENASGSRVLKISETADSQSDAYYKAAAKVNQSNEEATTISGNIFPNPKIVAGVCIKITGMGKANGKYFVDKVKTEIGSSGTTQEITAHKCQTRLKYTPASTAKKSTSSTKTYKVGDVVQFKGGKHYVSSYSGAKGYTAKAGPAKITKGPDCKGNGGAHPYHLIHTTSKSNVYGWVDEGTFE
ncbi:MAG: hypothetical protein LUC83_03010 [Clostridiales bacterium]|nr:hypothetical protein [Clostridiales bacterium]